MDNITARKLEYILSGYQVSSEDLNEIIDLIDTYKEQESKAENLPISDVSKPCHTTEIVQKWPDGTEEVKYRATYGSKEALDLMKQVNERANKSGYFYRHVC